MNTTRTLKIGTIATFAAVAVLTGCARDEPETGTSSSSSTVTPSSPSSPGTSGYVGPGSGSSPSTMTPPPAGTSDPASSSSSSSSSPPGSTSSSDTTAPSSSGYVGGSSSSPAPSDPASSSGTSGGTGSSSMDSPPAGSSTPGSGTPADNAPSGSGSSGTTPSSPTSSLDGADRPFRDVAVAGPNDRSLGPVAWRKLLGVEVIRVAEEGATSGASQGGMAGESKASGQKLSKKDRKFLDKAATSGMFEVEAARLAAERATDAQVKSFAAKLMDHHQQANEELKQLASARGVTLPSKLPSKEQAMLDRLTKASADKFDQEFLKTVGLRDHKQDIRQFENAQNETNDAELKAWIAKTLPTLRTHLAEAQSMSGEPGKMQGYAGGGETPKSGSDAGKEAPRSGAGGGGY